MTALKIEYKMRSLRGSPKKADRARNMYTVGVNV